MEHVGTVIEVRGETAVVSMRRHLSCENCGRCGVMMGKPDLESTVEVLNPIRAAAGQRVIVESDDRRMLFTAFMLYMLPLAALMAGVLLWMQFAPALGFGGRQELAAVAAGFALMAPVYLGIRRWDRRVKNDRRYKPVIINVVTDETAGEQKE